MPHRGEGMPSKLLFETARERDLYQYYQPLHSPQAGFESAPQSSYDTTLSAFAQLTTLRLNTRRAMISLIDRTNQHILAEATRTLSLQSDSVHNDHDELWFGCTTIPRSHGLCESALEISPLSPSRNSSALIINDLADDDEFKHRPFVRNRPSLRFYAATPISTQSGFNIGTLCVMDDNPRDGLSNVEIAFLDDMALSIMTHLEMTRVKKEHRRSEKMVKGLGLFVEGGDDLSEWTLGMGNSTAGEQEGFIDSSEFQHVDIVGLQGDGDLNLQSVSTEKSVPSGKTSEPEAVAHVKSPKGPLSGFQPGPVRLEDIQGQTNAQATVKLHPILAIHSDSGENSTVSSSETQEIFSPPAPTLSTSPTLASSQSASPKAITPEVPLPTGSNQSSRTSSADLQETMFSTSLKEMFSRASKIIRECIEVEGTIFLDASVGTFGADTGAPLNKRGPSDSEGSQSNDSLDSSIEGYPTTPNADEKSSRVSQVGNYAFEPPENPSTKTDDEKEKCCGILSFSTGEEANINGDGSERSYTPVSEAFLKKLLHKYPYGHVFSFEDGDTFIASTNDPLRTTRDPAPTESIYHKKSPRKAKHKCSANKAEVRSLLQMLPGAQSVVFFPLWDSHRERWFAGSFAWTTQSTRVLTRAADLSYLAAFGNSIMAEVARLDTMAADRAKSDFISSISHELRSPLHGILASVEFLQSTAVDLFQNSMIDTIERCGKTLLDTIQHVLDFAKINNFTKSKTSQRKEEKSSPKGHDRSSHTGMKSLSVDVDLSTITEDVIESMYAGHQFQRNPSLRVADEITVFPSEDLRRNSSNARDTVPDQPLGHSALRKDQLAIIVDIGWRSNWNFYTQSGALSRVLMNLFGNSLKYTNEGWINISLESEDIKPAPSQPQQSRITIVISDSGSGMSQEFLQTHLFTPFAQESPLNPGTGLGMSIVLQIVRSLGGTVEVESELGVGTKVKVSLILNQAIVPAPTPPLGEEHNSCIVSIKERTRGLNLGLLGFDVSSVMHGAGSNVPKVDSQLPLSFQESFKRMTTQWFGMNIVASDSREAPSPDIYLANGDVGGHFSSSEVPIIILCDNLSLYRAHTRRMGNDSTQNHNHGLIHFVSKPCGPHKLAKAFAFCLGKARRSPINQKMEMSPVGFLCDLASPQSLSSISPDLQKYSVEVRGENEYFPTSANSSYESSSLPTASLANTVTKRKPILLLVDDNHINLKLLQTFSKRNDYEYATAENGQLALEAFRSAQHRYDVVLLDISMPVMNGMDSARGMRKVEHDRGQKPAIIIALTGLASASARQEAYSSGINFFWTKPVSFRELRKFLKDWTAGIES